MAAALNLAISTMAETVAWLNHLCQSHNGYGPFESLEEVQAVRDKAEDALLDLRATKETL